MAQEIQARHILVEQRYQADDLQKKLDDGADFGDLAKKFSTCPSSKDGGNLGSFGRGRMVKSFDEAAFELNVGEISEPIQTQFGYHLIQRTK